jgi:hypothetical protein
LYTFHQHIHNYAVWTAARASQRGFTTTRKIKVAIESTDLQQFAINSPNISSKQFDELHKQWARQIIKSLKKQNVNASLVTYGRAAKIIAIYLKTAVIIRDKAKSKICDIIHPPIDFIFITAISKRVSLKEIKNNKWTKLNEKEYWSLCSKIKNEFSFFNWKLEEFWTPELAV